MRIRNNAGKVLEALGVLLLAVAVLICLPVTLPRLWNYQIYAAVSDNVGPQIAEGSLVYVRTFAGENLQAGDIVVFYSSESGGVVMQTVKENEPEEELLTAMASDGETQISLAVSYAQVLGKVAAVIPGLGYAMVWLANCIGAAVVAMLILVAVALILLGIRLRKREIEARQGG